MSLTLRTIRIAVSAMLAIMVATYIGLENPLAAGIIAILAVLNTRLQTIQRAFEYLFSTLLAFAIATVIFLVFDFSVFSFGVYLALYVPLAHQLKVDAGIAPCSVLVTHFIIAGSVSWQWQINGLLIMVIGLVFALLANFWNPSYSSQLEEKMEEIEKQMSLTLFLMEKRLLEGNHSTGRIKTELDDLCDEVEEFEDLALIEYENSQFARTQKDYYVRYGQMRTRQYEILSRITDSLDYIQTNTEEHKILASIFGETAETLNVSNPGIALLEQIGDLYRVFRDSELPDSRDEFESRAILYSILTDFEKFLELKRDFYRAYGEEGDNTAAETEK